MSKFKNGDGFHIRVNLYIIRFLFCHMDSKNNPNLSKEVKKRRPAYLLYSEDYFPVRQRMDRINKGENFEFSNKEAEGLSKLFAIDKSHFTNKSSEPFPIQGITVTDWAYILTLFYV